MNRENLAKKSMMEIIKSIDDKPSNCKILVPTASHKRMNQVSMYIKIAA